MHHLIAIVQGPNLNTLGQRQPHIYGTTTLESIHQALLQQACDFSAQETVQIELSFFQSNYEGALVDHIQKLRSSATAIIINPAAYTHTSVALRDALLYTELPIVEVHLGNIYQREAFRQHSYVSDIAEAVFSGAKHHGYSYALDYLMKKCKNDSTILS